MVKAQELAVSLEEFGLSKYEARVYVALISKGTISASEVSYYAEIPRTKVYPILLKLEKKKLVIISKSKPIICTSIAPEDAFDYIVHEQINKVNAMNTLVTKLKQVNEENKKDRGAEEKRYFHINANNVLNQLKTMMAGAKSSIHIIVDPLGFNLLAECKEQLLTVLRREVDVKIIIPTTQVGSESFHLMPNGVQIRMSETLQSYFIFDQTELLLIDDDDGKGAVFSSTDVIGNIQTKVFSQLWKNAFNVESLYDMTKKDAQEICHIINLIIEHGLGFMLNAELESKNTKIDLLELLEKNGINLAAKTMDEVIELIDSTVKITCAGNVNYDSNNKNITIESKVNGGHSLAWSSLLDSYLRRCGHTTNFVYQNKAQKGEKIYIKIK